MRRRLSALGVIGVLISAAVFHLWPALSNCRSTILATVPGDATAEVWQSWQWDVSKAGPWASESPYVNAPFGESLWRPLYITTLGIAFPKWAVAKLAGPVCGWNLMVLLGLAANALLMFGLVRWLTQSNLVSLFAGYAYAFSPYHLLKAEAHLAFVHSWILVLIIWSFFALWKNSTFPRAVLFGGAIALAFYTNGYYILIGGVAVAVMLATGIAYAVLKQGRAAKNKFRGAAISALVAIFLSLPIFVIYLRHRQQITTELARSHPIAEAFTYGARAREYVTPARRHPVFSSIFGSYQDRNLHGSNIYELTLFLGWTVLVLAVAGLVPDRSSSTDQDQRLPRGLIVSTLSALVVASLAFSLPPKVNLFGLTLTSPPGVVVAITSFWRVFARFFLLLHAALVILAAMGLKRLISARPPRAGAIIVALLTSLLAFEFLIIPPRKTFNYKEVPRVYEWLAQQAGVSIVAEYPMLPTETQESLNYFAYQPVHKKRIFNSALDDSADQALRDGARGLADPQTLPVLRSLGIQMVLWHRPSGIPRSQVPLGFAEVERFSNDYAFEVSPGSTADLGLGLVSGFRIEDEYALRSNWLMANGGEMRVFRLLGSAGTGRVTFRAKPLGDLKKLVVEQQGRELWRGLPDGGLVRFNAAVEQPIRLRALTSGGPRETPQVALLSVSEVAAVPVK